MTWINLVEEDICALHDGVHELPSSQLFLVAAEDRLATPTSTRSNAIKGNRIN